MKLEGKTALVTGGGGGIGTGIVRCLAEEGADVAVVDIDIAAAESVAKDGSRLGRRCIPIRADVSQPEEIDRLVQSVIAQFGKLDILVNNAGVGAAPDWDVGEPLRVEDWDYVYKVNLRAYYLTWQAVSPHMMERRFGKIVNVASVAGRVGGGPNESMWAYRMSKAAVINLSQSMAVLMGPAQRKCELHLSRSNLDEAVGRETGDRDEEEPARLRGDGDAADIRDRGRDDDAAGP